MSYEYPLIGPRIKFSKTSNNKLIYFFEFKNKQKQTIVVQIGAETQPHLTISISFYNRATKTKKGSNYNEVTNSGDMFRVISTVVEATKKVIESVGGMENIAIVKISTIEKQRRGIYKKYTEARFPDFKVVYEYEDVCMYNKIYWKRNGDDLTSKIDF